MMKTFGIVSTAILAFASFAIPARAQGPFSDLPKNHWAYAAVDELKNAGIVEGYPDKTYGGSRPLTRYEFSMAFARLLDRPCNMIELVYRNQTRALQSEIDSGRFATKDDIGELRQMIEELHTELGSIGSHDK